uniref:Glucuronosyltransferase n=1 Tax=Panagrolaimus sp. JU765 TaxID=591449 RepID=A0AC34QTS9_9BILA
MVQTANILHFVPTLSYSHVAFNGKLADILVEEGHNVTVMLINVDPSVSSSAIEKAEIFHVNANMSSGILPSVLWHNPGPFENASPLNPKIVRKLIRVASIFAQTCKNVMADKNLISEMSSRNFDIGIVEQYDMCGIGFLKLIKVKSIVWLSATANYRMQPETLGINYPLSYVPELFSPFSDKMTLLERILNSGIASVTEILHKTLSIAEENRIFKRITKKINYNLFNEARDSSCMVTNTQPFLDFPAPTSHNVVNIGGLSVPVKRKSKLNKQWQKIAKKGPFIVVTFGSIAKTVDMPDEMQDSLFRAFKALPDYNFIVKYEKLDSEIIQISNNVFLARWLPQIDLICHENYQGIVTHGGWSSVLESLSYGKPMLLMPLFADHFKNARVIESFHLGLVVDKMKIDSNTFTDAITKLVKNQRYVQKSKQFSEMLHNSSPAELRAVVSHEILKYLKPSSKFVKNNFRLKSSTNSFWLNNFFDVPLICLLLILIVAS